IPQAARINVTYRGKENMPMRVEAAKSVRELGFVPVPHISARRLKSQAELEEFLGELQQAGASEHVFVVGGDPQEPEGDYPDSLSVIDSRLEEHTSELQSRFDLVCRLLLEKKK